MLAILPDTAFVPPLYHLFSQETSPSKAPYPLIALPTLRPKLTKSYFRSILLGKFTLPSYHLAKVLKQVAMSEDITLLTSAHHNSLTKTFSGPNLRVQPFEIGKDFYVSDEPVSDLQSLSQLLQRLESEPTQTIIRGSLIEGKTNPVSSNKETFAERSQQ